METAKPSLGLSIKQIWAYTMRVIPNRLDNFERDILPSKISIIKRKTYTKDRIDQFDEILEIQSFSAPQYPPYNKVKSKGAKKQMKIKHRYDIVMQLQKDTTGEYTTNSKIRWRVGSYKKWNDKPPKKQIASISRIDRLKMLKQLQDKYDEETVKEKKQEKIANHRKSAKYLDIGDYNAQVNAINGDEYFRNQWYQNQYNVLYGKLVNMEKPKDKKIRMAFFGKHMIGALLFLVKKGLIKGNLI